MTHITPQEFVRKWRAATVTERAGSQSHFNDLCELLGVDPPLKADPHGERFAFEKGATKATGGQGFADVWKRDCFGWEYKGKHANLNKAYEQLLKYQGNLGNPPLLIVSDIETIIIHKHFTGYADDPVTLTLDDLLRPDKLDLLRSAFTEPAALKPNVTTEHVTRQAAEKFGAIAERMGKYGHEPQAVAHFLIRVLFCLFAEDVGILPNQLFSRLLSQPGQNAARLQQQLRQLFAAMAEGGYFGEHVIKHVDGGLFNDDAALLLDSDSVAALAQISRQNWGAIEPAILGTLFERGLDPAKRSQQGAHYTSRDDILLVVEPVLMAPLRRTWAEVRAEGDKLAAQLAEIDARAEADKSAAGLAKRRAARTKARNKLTELLGDFRQKLAAVQVLDPACGSGNFLYVSLRLLLDLEKEVIEYDAATGGSWSNLMVGPRQLHGIEINPYAQELAQATIWIGYIQWWRENGFGLPAEPILQPLEAIVRMDAILAYDAEGKPVEPEWPAADVIVGNPPFLGDKKMRGELGDKYVEDLRRLYAGRVPGGADLVTYWFEKARAMIEARKVKRAGLLATQGIRGGANRKVLDRIKASGDIFLAWSDRNWVLNGAVVHISIVAFDDGSEEAKELNHVLVQGINANLTALADLTQARILGENAGLAFIGTQKGGPFDISQEAAAQMLLAIGNPNGRTNREVVRPWINGLDVTRRLRNMWVVDFNELSESEASAFEAPFEYVRVHVKAGRETSASETSTTQRWWLHQRPRPEMRQALNGLTRYIATARVAKHRIFIWSSVDVLPDSQVVVIARQDDYSLGVLHSRVHELWALSTGTQLRDAESGFRYSQTMTFQTYPFPWPPGREPADDPRVLAIAEAARELVAKRDAWLNPEGASEADLAKRTLTNLYNERPTWLRLAHDKLDRAVLDAYGWPHDLPDEDILARLLALNGERAATA